MKFSKYIPVYIFIFTFMILGLYTRFTFIWKQDFPINDGGLFTSLILDLQNNQYSLPIFTTYNNAQIPFAYPPIGFYMAGIITDFFGIEITKTLQILPAVISIFTIFCFHLLSKEILPDYPGRIFSLLAFIFIPDSFRWLIMGGGLTRSLGLLFGLLALYFVIRFYKDNDSKISLPAILFCGLTTLSHPPTTLFLIYTIVIIFVFFNPTKIGIQKSITLLLGTFVIIFPWFYIVTSRHGITTLLSASKSGYPFLQNILRFVLLKLSNEPLVPVWTFIGIIGFIIELFRKKFFLPAWLLAVYIFQLRATDHVGVIPLSLLAGIAGSQMISWYTSIQIENQYKKLIGMIMISVIFVYSIIMVNLVPAQLATSLPEKERQAMRWLDQNSAPTSTVLVVSGLDWFADSSSEWLPVLTNRPSVAVVQGYEWLDTFSERVYNYEELQYCSTQGPDCIEDWQKKTNIDFTHIFVPIPCIEAYESRRDNCGGLRSALNMNEKYEKVFENENAAIYAVKK